MAYDRHTHGDFKKYYDTEHKRNYWVLGYFGGGPLNIAETHRLCMEFHAETMLPWDSIYVDEILYSRRFKGFKFIYSDAPDQKPEKDSHQTDNVLGWLHD